MMKTMVNVNTSAQTGAFGEVLAKRLQSEQFEGDFSVQIGKPQTTRDGNLVTSGVFPPDTDATLVMLNKPITAEATLKFVRLISDAFCDWTIHREQGEHVSKKRRALIIREGEAERTLRTILFDDVGS